MAPQKAHGLGVNVRRLREAHKLSANALARAADISQGHLWDIETGRARDPGVSVVRAIAKALDVSVDDLLREEPAKAAPPAKGEG